MIYFDNAATSFPKIQEAYKAAYEAMTEYGANPGRSGHSLSLRAARCVMDCREQLARYLKIKDPMRIAFTYSATDAINTVIMGLLHRGERVIAGPYEHNAVMRPLKELEREGQIELHILKSTESEELRSAIKPNTALCVLNNASNVTGETADLKSASEVLREYGIPLLADCAQTAGILDISPDASGAQFIALPGHKGLHGLHGTGALYVADGFELRPFRFGGTGSSSESMYQPREMPDALESGTQNLVGIAALCEGTKFIQEHLEEIREYEKYLTDALREMLRSIKGLRILETENKPYLGVTSFTLGSLSSGEIADYLDENGICVRGGLHCAPSVHSAFGTLSTGAVRASVGLFNTMDEVKALASAVERLAKQSS